MDRDSKIMRAGLRPEKMEFALKTKDSIRLTFQYLVKPLSTSRSSSLHMQHVFRPQSVPKPFNSLNFTLSWL